MLSSREIRQKYLDFFKSKDHAIIPSASLLPEDKTVLFNTAGMQPLVPYLLGAPHPSGKRLANVQKCLRTDDILEVGDNRHLTFFEMLGNWSLGDYFKKDSIAWSFELLTSKDWFGIDPQKIYVTVFEGDKEMGVGLDTESIEHWTAAFKAVGIEASLENGRISKYPKKKNWWELAGPGPCGPDTEIFYDTGLTHDRKYGEVCHVNCDCGKYVEIWNNVFMEYEKKIGPDGKLSYSPLTQKNVDTGMGFERMVMLMQNAETVFDTDLFTPITSALGDLPVFSKRIVADHLRASVYLIADGVRPSNKDQGYILRRLIRRAIPHLKNTISPIEVIKIVIKEYSSVPEYAYLKEKEAEIIEVIQAEEKKFANVYKDGEKKLNTLVSKLKEENETTIPGRDIFDLTTTYGFSFEWIKDIADMNHMNLDTAGYEKEMERHKELSRAGAEKKFGGHGLILNTGELKAGSEEELKKVTRLHTATHLMQAALREVLGPEVEQRGSDITAERTRFDFSFPRKMTDEEIKKVEDWVNAVVAKSLPMQKKEMPFDEAKKTGALHFFKTKYPDTVNVYFAGNNIEDAVSKEFCGGPHVANTSEIGKFKIVKEEGVSAGVRRIRANVF